MEPIGFKNAYYIKLGRKGEWEKSSIEDNKVRISWAKQILEDINQRNWDVIRMQLEEEFQQRGNQNKGAVTCDFNALKSFIESTSDDIWITFHASFLWWCRLGSPKVEQDQTSKYREVSGQWHSHDINNNLLMVVDLGLTSWLLKKIR